MGDPASPWGRLVGHNGGGPCYSASVFHAFDLGGATVCAMGAIEKASCRNEWSPASLITSSPCLHEPA